MSSITVGVVMSVAGSERDRRGRGLPGDGLLDGVGDQIDGVDTQGRVAGAASAYAPLDLVEVLQCDFGGKRHTHTFTVISGRRSKEVTLTR